MSTEKLEKSVLRQMGEPKGVARDLARFRKAAKALSSKHPRLVEEFPKQWVVFYEGKVKARGQTMHSALLQARQQNLPLGKAIVRYIDRNDRTFIL